ncbi:MAG: cytochrome bc complex cytochrome b subunit [Spirochaetia bacterium]|nr:cytochrome bc complex cytochrome b subunit [Spirochaetia bacterium]
MDKKKILSWLSERVPIDPESLRHFGSEPVPNHLKHWWWALGGTPAYFFFVQVVTGILLSFYYTPHTDTAYESVKNITENVPYGWYIRSVHMWSSNFMIVTVILHMMRVFFTGSYRKPREINWMIGVGLLITTFIFGFTGYSLVFEQLSYWGLTVAANITEATPFIGQMMADFIRAGSTITEKTISRIFILHIGVLPTLMIMLIIAHLGLIRLLGVTEFTFTPEEKKLTFPFFPNHILSEMAIGTTLMFIVTILAIIFPAELHDKANPLVTPPHIKPEWYFYFTFRWLKLTSLTFAVLSMGFFVFILFLWPFIDAWLRRKKPNSEISMAIGVVTVIILITLTLWELFVLHYSH